MRVRESEKKNEQNYKTFRDALEMADTGTTNKMPNGEMSET